MIIFLKNILQSYSHIHQQYIDRFRPYSHTLFLPPSSHVVPATAFHIYRHAAGYVAYISLKDRTLQQVQAGYGTIYLSVFDNEVLFPAVRLIFHQ